LGLSVLVLVVQLQDNNGGLIGGDVLVDGDVLAACPCGDEDTAGADVCPCDVVVVL
jgi:hypothetical protein